jgi:hypothetical protein
LIHFVIFKWVKISITNAKDRKEDNGQPWGGHFVSPRLETRHKNNINFHHHGASRDSSARTPAPHHPGPHGSYLSQAALALVVVKRRLEQKRRRPSPSSDHQDNDGNDDGNHNSSMEFELETSASSTTNQLCPWMPLLGSQLSSATAGATSSTSTAWMNHRSSIPRTGTPNGNGNNVIPRRLDAQ